MSLESCRVFYSLAAPATSKAKLDERDDQTGHSHTMASRRNLGSTRVAQTLTQLHQHTHTHARTEIAEQDRPQKRFAGDGEA